ncbi:hypothetical protein diail_7492, partial [Diaporthe ilicicola]
MASSSASVPAIVPVSYSYWQNAYDSLDDGLKSRLHAVQTQRRDVVSAVSKAAKAKAQE